MAFQMMQNGCIEITIGGEAWGEGDLHLSLHHRQRLNKLRMSRKIMAEDSNHVIDIYVSMSIKWGNRLQ